MRTEKSFCRLPTEILHKLQWRCFHGYKMVVRYTGWGTDSPLLGFAPCVGKSFTHRTHTFKQTHRVKLGAVERSSSTKDSPGDE